MNKALVIALPNVGKLGLRRIERSLAPGELLFAETELQAYRSLTSDKRKGEFVAGRLAAKAAIGALTGDDDFQKLEVSYGAAGEPITSSTEISVSHSRDWAVAAAAPIGQPIGVDVEWMNPDRLEAVNSSMTTGESQLKAPPFQAWCLKEALAKLLKTGLDQGTDVLEIEEFSVDGGVGRCRFKEFAEYQGVAFQHKEYALAITAPHELELRLPVSEIKKAISSVSE